MCVPRAKNTHRDFSTSWGRSAFLSATTEMEMNPLLIFKNNCHGKQSVSTCLTYLQKYIGKTIRGKDITNSTTINFNEDIDIWYGIKNSKDLTNLIGNKKISFILTDPPYGGLVQYLDLSTIWLSWLELYDKKYSPIYGEEISINKLKTPQDYQTDMQEVFNSLYEVMCDNARLVLTFNNNKLIVWRSLLLAIQDSNLEIKKVLHQQNLRSGESQVKDKYGTSSCDFYIRCQKKIGHSSEREAEDFITFIIQQTKKLILDRNEPTPYQILFNGLLAEISISNFNITSFDDNIKNILNQEIGKTFTVIKNKFSSAGNLWWVKDEDFDSKNSNTLTNRIITDIKILLSQNNHLDNVKLFSMLYKNYPNGLTPDHCVINKIMEKFANKRGNLWIKK
jgi:hypothetical protein